MSVLALYVFFGTKGEEDLEVAEEEDVEDEDGSGSTRQALGVPRSMLCLARRCPRMEAMSAAAYEQIRQTFSDLSGPPTPMCSF